MPATSISGIVGISLRVATCTLSRTAPVLSTVCTDSTEPCSVKEMGGVMRGAGEASHCQLELMPCIDAKQPRAAVPFEDARQLTRENKLYGGGGEQTTHSTRTKLHHNAAWTGLDRRGDCSSRCCDRKRNKQHGNVCHHPRQSQTGNYFGKRRRESSLKNPDYCGFVLTETFKERYTQPLCCVVSKGMQGLPRCFSGFERRQLAGSCRR